MKRGYLSWSKFIRISCTMDTNEEYLIQLGSRKWDYKSAIRFCYYFRLRAKSSNGFSFDAIKLPSTFALVKWYVQFYPQVWSEATAVVREKNEIARIQSIQVFQTTYAFCECALLFWLGMHHQFSSTCCTILMCVYLFNGRKDQAFCGWSYTKT